MSWPLDALSEPQRGPEHDGELSVLLDAIDQACAASDLGEARRLNEQARQLCRVLYSQQAA